VFAPHIDIDGVAPCDNRLVPSARDSLDATLPLAPIASALVAADIPLTLSSDPGRYLCNAMLFHALHWAQGTPTRVGFVHIPHLAETGPLTPAQALTGARLIVETAISAESAVPATA
jgi:pyroglutamyl-peptidase